MNTNKTVTTSSKDEKFTIIPSIQSREKIKVKRKLPQWLDQPDLITADVLEQKMDVNQMLPALDDHLIDKLRLENITEFFPVQMFLIPELLKSSGELGVMFGKAGFRPRDICCSAPTGSGKTLAYVLPIIQVLQKRIGVTPRCLVVLPGTDLATQVSKVFKTYSAGTSLKIGLINGLKSFHAEQMAIINNQHMAVDILVATPGRLVDHITMTTNFNLTHLRFLVLDEADRMMDEMKQDWLRHVEEAVFKFQMDQSEMSDFKFKMDQSEMSNFQNDALEDMSAIQLINCHRNVIRFNNLHSNQHPHVAFQKLLFSATLSHDPEKLSQLRLYRPKLFMAKFLKSPASNRVNNDKEEEEKKYVIPASLRECFIECSKADKVCVLLNFIKLNNLQKILCFTNSTETTHRLCALLNLMDVKSRELSSRLHISKRTRLLRQLSDGKINILVCTDAIARGIDIDDVHCVVCYDAPKQMRTYVHRVGRTARAGKQGTCLSLLEKKEIFHFKKMMVGRVKEVKVQNHELKDLQITLQKALTKLPTVLANYKMPSLPAKYK